MTVTRLPPKPRQLTPREMVGLALAHGLLAGELQKLRACATKKYPVSGKQYARVFLEDGTVARVGPDGEVNLPRHECRGF